MLKVDMNFHKGILFVRLNGDLVKDTVSYFNDELSPMTRVISNVVFNVSDLSNIDYEGILALINITKLFKPGQRLLCGVNNSLVKYRVNNSSINNYMYETSNEFSAMSIINL